MSLFDRYTILKWKERFTTSKGDLIGLFGGVYRFCNSSAKTRFLSVVTVAGFLMLAAAGIYMLGPKEPVAVTPKIILMETDQNGIPWKMDYLKNQDIGSLLSGPVKPGQPLKLTFKFLRKDPFLLIKPEITGAAGEQYFPGILKNGQWQQPPKVTITDSKGNLLHKGQFEYG